MDIRFFEGTVSFILLVFVLCSLTSSSIAQGIQAWTNLNLYGGQIYDIAIDPCNPQKMFAGSYFGDGLFVTTDGGGTWQAVETEHELEGEDTFKNHAVFAVKIAPSDPKIVWVAHNLWVEKSTDGGLTWIHIQNRTMQQDCPSCEGRDDGSRFCTSLSIDPDDPDIVYVGTAGPWNTYASGAIYKTINGGLTWKKTGFDASKEFDYTVKDIDIDPQDNSVIWAVTSSEGHDGWDGTLYHTSDGGESWEEIYNWEGFPSSTIFYNVSVKPNDPNIVFTGSGLGLIKHYFNGSQWQAQWPIIEDSRIAWSIVFAPQNLDIIYTAWRNPWFGDHLPRIARSTNGGIDWDKPYIVDYEFMTLEVHPDNSEVIFGGDITQGVFKSEDHGQTWSPINNGINAVIVYDVAVDPKDSTHILAGTVSGVYEKRGTGEWLHLTTDVTRSVKFNPTDSEIFYAGIQRYVKKTMDGGSIWSLSNELGDGQVFDIAIDPFNNDILFVALSNSNNNGEIHKSIDGGNSFEKVLEGINLSGDRYSFNTVAIDPSDPNHVFAGGGNFYAPKVNGDLWESLKGGAQGTWTLTGLQDVIVNTLLIDPEDPNIMYAGCGYSAGTDIPVYKSTDGGKIWEPSYYGIPGISIGLNSIWGTSTTDVFAVGGNGAILHYDGVWSHMDSNSTEDLRGIWGASTKDIFAVGNNGTILHYNGSWSSMDSNTTEHLYDIWGVSSTNMFAVGNNGTILHYNGSWSSMESNTTEHLYDIWGISSTNMFTVGTNGIILNYDGSWSAMDSNTTEDLWGIWGNSPTNMFTVGNNGTILHYDGSWSAMKSGTTKDLFSIYGNSFTDVFAVGCDNTVLHYDGSTWSSMDLGITGISPRENLTDIWGTSGSDIFLIGERGNILHYNGNAWTTLRYASSWNSVTDLEFHPRDRNVIYASTANAGVYLSPNQGGCWLTLGKPEYEVLAIATSSLYAATEGGLWQCTGTGVIAGQVIDAISQSAIGNATVFSDLGVKTICVNGEYMMVSPTGEFNIIAISDNHAIKTIDSVTVNGGDITFVDIAMERGIPESFALPAQDIFRTSGGEKYCFIETVL